MEILAQRDCILGQVMVPEPLSSPVMAHSGSLHMSMHQRYGLSPYRLRKGVT